MGFGQSIECGRDAMDVPMRSPGVRGGTRDEPVSIMLRRHTTMLSGAFQLLGQDVELLSRLVSRIAHDTLPNISQA